MPIFHTEIAQGTAAWFALRSGRPTASEFHNLVTPKTGKLSAAWRRYAYRLLAERLLNWQAESLETLEHIANGKDQEPFAAAQYSAIENVTLERVGFVETDDHRAGASPDRIIAGRPMGIEIKCPSLPVHIGYLIDGHDEKYRPQIQGSLWVCQFDRWDFYSYNKRCPAAHIITNRDEGYIRLIAEAVDEFSDRLDEMTERARTLGIYQAFEEVRTPVDREYADNIRRAPLTTEQELAALIETEMAPGELHRAGA